MTAPAVTVLGWSDRGARAYVNDVRVTMKRLGFDAASL